MLLKEYGIVFPKNAPEAHSPANHRDVFKQIQKLGTYKYDGYAEGDDDLGLAERPWRYPTKQLAKKLTEKAEQCVRRNEASWRFGRFACEPLVFAHFSAEVAWGNNSAPYLKHLMSKLLTYSLSRVCRKRFWRSEIEASPTSSSRSAEQLKRRQHRRESCAVLRSARPQDLLVVTHY
jgi:hypothetical protein